MASASKKPSFREPLGFGAVLSLSLVLSPVEVKGSRALSRRYPPERLSKRFWRGKATQSSSLATGRFEQAERDRLEQQGTGLGLPIAQGLIRLHDGHIAVESTPGEGSTFSILLPAAGEATEEDGGT